MPTGRIQFSLWNCPLASPPWSLCSKGISPMCSSYPPLSLILPYHSSLPHCPTLLPSWCSAEDAQWLEQCGRDTLQLGLLCVFWRALGVNMPSEVSCKSKCDGSGRALARIGRHGFPRSSIRFLQSWFEHTWESCFIPGGPASSSCQSWCQTPHTTVFKPFSAPLFSLHRYPVDFAPGRNDNHQLFRDNTPTSDCTFPLPCSHWDWTSTKQLYTFDLCLHNRNSLFSDRLEPSPQLWHTAWLQQ